MRKLGGVTHQAKSLERSRGIRKNKIVLGRLGLMVQSDSI